MRAAAPAFGVVVYCSVVTFVLVSANAGARFKNGERAGNINKTRLAVNHNMSRKKGLGDAVFRTLAWSSHAQRAYFSLCCQIQTVEGWKSSRETIIGGGGAVLRGSVLVVFPAQGATT